MRTKKEITQPLQLLYVDDAQLKLDLVSALTGLSKTTIYDRMADTPPRFPQPIRHGKRCTRWKAADVRAFLEANKTSK